MVEIGILIDSDAGMAVDVGLLAVPEPLSGWPRESGTAIQQCPASSVHYPR